MTGTGSDRLHRARRAWARWGGAVAVLWLVVGALCAGCQRKATPEADSAVKADKPPVAAKFERVQQRVIEASLDLSGTLAAEEQSEVPALVAGAVVAVNVDVGSRVKKGDLLVELDRRESAMRSAQASATREQANARLGEAQTGKFDPEKVPDVKVAKEAFELAKSEADRAKTLFQSGAVSESVWDQARTRADQARSQYDMAVAGAKQAHATLLGASAASGLAGKSLADTKIRAPFDGSVAERRISLGEFATVGRVVAVVVNDSTLRLKLDVPEVDVGRVKAGARVEVSVVAYPGRVFVGEVKRIGASVKALSRALPVEAEVPNPDGALRPGMFGRARIMVAGASIKATLVPQEAIGSTGASARVFVRSGDRVVERLVVPGRKMGPLVEVTGDLKDGDEVAVSGVDQLADGSSVVVR